MTDDQAEYGLVMPFIVTTSEGGPYDSEAFVAGFTAAVLDESLREAKLLVPNGLAELVVKKYVSPKLIPQLDLIAMRHGFILTHEPWDEHPDEWTMAIFTLGDLDAT